MLDTAPTVEYQPLPWLGKAGERAEGTYSRWTEIRRAIEGTPVTSALDIGANIGFFSISLGLRGVEVVALEREPRYQRILRLATGRLGLENVSILELSLAPCRVRLLPRADLVLFLSVWHHVVREHGLKAAEKMLGEVWERCESVMIFDTGQDEMPEHYGLPNMEPNAREWVENLLSRHCEGGRVEYLGEHAAFDPAGRPCTRSLFAVRRQTGS